MFWDLHISYTLVRYCRDKVLALRVFCQDLEHGVSTDLGGHIPSLHSSPLSIPSPIFPFSSLPLEVEPLKSCLSAADQRVGCERSDGGHALI